MLISKKKVMDALLEDKAWNGRLGHAATLEEARDVMLAFAKERGFKVLDLSEERRRAKYSLLWKIVFYLVVPLIVAVLLIKR